MWPSACLLATDSRSQLPLDTHGFTYTYANTHIHFRYRPVHKCTHTHTAHIWFCFTNGVASDLTTPYKACLVPLILSWRMRAHTKTHTHTALIDYTVLGQREWHRRSGYVLCRQYEYKKGKIWSETERDGFLFLLKKTEICLNLSLFHLWRIENNKKKKSLKHSDKNWV